MASSSRTRAVVVTATFVVLGLACSSSDDGATSGAPIPGGHATPDASLGSDGASSPVDGGLTEDGRAPGTVDDPTKAGPRTTSDTTASTGAGTVTLKAFHPTSGAAPYPIVFIAPGATVPVVQYEGYATRLASHGIIGVTVGYAQSFKDPLKDAKNLEAALAWAANPGATLAEKIDLAHAGVMGHSRGGKAAVLAALANKGFKAVLGLDPVDSKPAVPCDATTECPDATSALGALTVPSAFLGETIDAAAAGVACAAAADNYATFFASAPAPSLEVTILGASHFSFIADRATCGGVCDFCQPATRAQAEVLEVAYAYTAAFFRRHLRGETAMDTYLTGAEADARFVKTNIVTLRSK